SSDLAVAGPHGGPLRLGLRDSRRRVAARRDPDLLVRRHARAGGAADEPPHARPRRPQRPRCLSMGGTGRAEGMERNADRPPLRPLRPPRLLHPLPMKGLLPALAAALLAPVAAAQFTLTPLPYEESEEPPEVPIAGRPVQITLDEPVDRVEVVWRPNSAIPDTVVLDATGTSFVWRP